MRLATFKHKRIRAFGLRVTSSRIYRAPGKPLSGFQDACGRRYLGVFDLCH